MQKKSGIRTWRGVLLGLLLGGASGAQAAELRDLRIWAGPDSTRVVFDLSGSASHRLFTLRGPDRVVIDLDDTALGDKLRHSLEGKGVVKRIRTGKRKDGDLRVVLDMAAEARSRSFSLPPNGHYGHRVVVDLYPQAAAGEPAAAKAPVLTEAAAPEATAPAGEPATRDRLEQKPIIIAIDAGHGGEDPGAIGPSGVREKDVALSLARELERLVNAEPGFKARMVRDGDYFVPLRERIALARKYGADLFISIHANSFHDRRVGGSAVYALSQRGASSEQARLLAARENEADAIGGVPWEDKEETLRKVLLDISQTSAIEASIDVGARILDGISDTHRLHKKEVQQAGFAVLKAPDIPSVLVETAFISNPREERLLSQQQGQRQLAASIMKGIRGYFANYRPLRYVAANPDHSYIVKRGDTLSHVANRYRVSLSALRRANGLDGDLLRVGDILSIPVTN